MFGKTFKRIKKVDPLYDWRPESTYIRRPPYWEGALARGTYTSPACGRWRCPPFFG